VARPFKLSLPQSSIRVLPKTEGFALLVGNTGSVPGFFSAFKVGVARAGDQASVGLCSGRVAGYQNESSKVAWTRLRNGLPRHTGLKTDSGLDFATKPLVRQPTTSKAETAIASRCRAD